MVNISKRKLDEYVFDKLLAILYEIFTMSRKEPDFKSFFESIFSYSERVMLIKRIGIIYLLIKNIKNYEICKTLKISTATLNKYVLVLDKNVESYKYFKKIINLERIKSNIEELINTLYGPGTPGVDWSEARKTQRKIFRRKSTGL